MRNTITYLVVLMSLMLPGLSCNVEDDKEPIIVPVLEDEFYLDLWQELGPEGNDLFIEFRTLANEDCLNAQILSDYERINRNLTLTLFEILAPENCIPGEKPAQGQEQFTGLNEGNYNLVIDLQDVIRNEGTLLIDEFGIQANTPANGFQWLHNRIERIPGTALWGYFVYQNESEQVWSAQRLIELSSFSTSSPDWTPGYYGYFDYEGNGNFSLAPRLLPAEGSILPFLVNYEDEEALAAWLAISAQELAEGMELRIFAGNGAEWSF